MISLSSSKTILLSIVLLALLLITSGLGYYLFFNQNNLATQFDLNLGKSIYNNRCIACHLPGQLGAPRLGHAEEWAPRIGKGLDTLFHNSLQGFNAMPARGGDAHLSDEEVKSAVAFMVNESS